MRAAVAPIGIASMLALAGPAGAQSPLRVEREKVLASDGETRPVDVPLSPLRRAPGLAFRHTVHEPGARSLRLHFRVRAPGRAWAVKVLPEEDSEAWWLTSEELVGEEFWSDDVRGSQATVEVYSAVAGNPLSLSIDGVAVGRAPVRPVSITPPDQRAPVLDQSSAIRTWARSVARLRFMGDDGKRYFCSSLLVSADLLMTNDHCMQSDEEVRSTLVDFDYDSEGARFSSLKIKERIASDAPLDYALYRLKEPTGRAPLRLKSAAAVSGRPLLVIQHPAGEPKQVSLADCKVAQAEVVGVGTEKTDFGHRCDTLGGSSGSPVLEPSTGDAVGLHHLGFHEGVPDAANQAVRMGLILDHLKTARPDVFPEVGTTPP